MEKDYKIIFTGGGSGGHTMPAVSIINGLLKKPDLYNILYIGSKKGVEKDIIQKCGIKYRSISTGKLRRYLSFENFLDIFKILAGILQSFIIIFKFKPGLLFSTGGFVSIPPVIAAKLLRIKIIIHEQTIDAGLANKIAAKFADKICITFQESSKYFPENKTAVTGIPLRPVIFAEDREKSKSKFAFDYSLPVLFFTGGGLGCRKLNLAGLEIIPELIKKTNIIFQTGKSNNNEDFNNILNLKDSLDESLKKRLYVYDFIGDEIGDIYEISDLVIARSGAGTVCELMCLKKPALFIPLAIATNNEQHKNACILRDRKAALILEESELTGSRLHNEINSIIFTDKIRAMKEAYKEINNPDGLEKIIKIIENEFFR